ncbi:MAG: WG repeat-containing protein, partial [Chitinophagaceae bacterium]
MKLLLLSAALLAATALHAQEPFKSGDRWGFRHEKDSTVIVPPRYDSADRFYEGRAAVQLQGKWGFIDAQGHEVVPPRYDDVLAFNYRRAGVKSGATWRFINPAGRELGAGYDEVEDFEDGYAIVTRGGLQG